MEVDVGWMRYNKLVALVVRWKYMLHGSVISKLFALDVGYGSAFIKLIALGFGYGSVFIKLIAVVVGWKCFIKLIEVDVGWKCYQQRRVNMKSLVNNIIVTNHSHNTFY